MLYYCIVFKERIIGYKYTRCCLWNAAAALNNINPSVGGGATLDLGSIFNIRLQGNNHKQKIRVERQEYPNQEVADAFIRKLYPDGHLIEFDNPMT